MDIRIGNNIFCVIKLNALGVQTVEDIKYVRATFTSDHNDHEAPCDSQFYDSEYTIHDCAVASYNVIPSNIYTHDSCSHEPCVYEDYSSPAKTNDAKDSIILSYPSNKQKPGSCSVSVELLLIDESAIVKTFNYEDVFTIYGNDLCCDCKCKTEDVYVYIGGDTEIDTWVMSASVRYLLKLRGMWSIFMMRANKYNLDSLVINKDEDPIQYVIPTSIRHTNDRIVILSKYDNLLFLYNGLSFPVSKVDIDGGYYVYISLGQFLVQNTSIVAFVSDEPEYVPLDFNLDQIDEPSQNGDWMFMWIDYDPVMAYGEEQIIACYVIKGGLDITDQVSIWKIERDGGDVTSDRVWNNSHRMESNEIMITYNDLISSINKTKFTITATVDGRSTVSEIII